MILEAEQTEDFSVLLLVCLLSKKENLYQVAIEMVKRKQMVSIIRVYRPPGPFGQSTFDSNFRPV